MQRECSARQAAMEHKVEQLAADVARQHLSTRAEIADLTKAVSVLVLSLNSRDVPVNGGSFRTRRSPSTGRSTERRSGDDWFNAEARMPVEGMTPAVASSRPESDGYDALGMQ
eukprot:1627243-Rhodomonas_salina.1